MLKDKTTAQLHDMVAKKERFIKGCPNKYTILNVKRDIQLICDELAKRLLRGK